MRRRWTGLIATAFAATSLMGAAPAQAAESDACIMTLRSQDIVEISPGQIDIYPENAGPYASHVIASAQAYVNCVVNETAGPLVACAKAYVNNRPTVTIDPITLHITISYAEFLGTTCSI
jgi:hypothetical protein